MDELQFRIVLPNGQASDFIDAKTLISCAESGQLQPSSQVFAALEGRWMCASDVVLLNSYWKLNGVIPSYKPTYVHDLNPRSKTLERVVVAIGLAVFAASPYIVHSIRQSSGILKPAGTLNGQPAILMTSTDGLYAVSVPATWDVPEHTAPDVRAFYDQYSDREFSIRKMTSYSCNSDATRSLCVAKVNYDITQEGRAAIGSPSEISVGRYSGWSEMMRGNVDGNDQFIKLNVISTPDGVYNLAEFRDANDNSGKPLLDNILNTFRKTSK